MLFIKPAHVDTVLNEDRKIYEDVMGNDLTVQKIQSDRIRQTVDDCGPLTMKFMEAVLKYSVSENMSVREAVETFDGINGLQYRIEIEE